MALTPASILADYSSGIGTQGATLKVNTNEKRVGIGTTNPQGTLQVGTAITMGSGIVTATSFDANTASFSGNVSVGGTLTYEDVTSVDSVGIITARSDVIVGGGLSVTGISTFNGITTSTTTLFANNFSVSGVSTLGGNVVVGGATTDLLVNGDARVTGILTVGTASLTLDGTTGKITGGSLTDAQVAAISSEISESDIVDVFVYDTSKDSDGGAWRKRTQHTSWYSETLNTATRGSRKEFPSVAVIVTTSDGSNDSAAEVRIYDGDDPDLPMWMVFRASGGAGPSASRFAIPGVNNLRASVMLNGILCIAVNDSGSTGRAGLEIINFLSETTEHLSSALANGNVRSEDSIAKRNTAISNAPTDDSRALVNNAANDVAITVLPNAPIDDATGLPVPTIALATDGGVSIVTDSGNVYDSNDTSASGSVDFTFHDDIRLVSTRTATGSAAQRYFISQKIDTIAGDSWSLFDYYTGNFTNGFPRLVSGDNGAGVVIRNGNNGTVLGSNVGLALWYAKATDVTTSEEYTNSLLCGISTSYNTGWMHGDIKGAFLSGISTADVTGSELITNGTFNTNTDDWSGTLATISHQTDKMRVTNTDTNGWAYQGFSVTSGKKYVATINLTSLGTASNLIWRIGTASNPDGGPHDASLNINSTGIHTLTFTASQSTLYFIVRVNGVSGTYLEVDDISVRLAEEDRSVNNNGLQVFGTINKNPVAGSNDTAADLVGYSNFGDSSANARMLKQPYNSDLDFGTGDFSATGWFYMTDVSLTGFLFDRATPIGGSEGNRIALYTENSLLKFYTKDGVSNTEESSSLSGYNNTWVQFTVTRKSNGHQTIYLNGNLTDEMVGVSRNVTNTTANLIIGHRCNYTGASNAFDGSLALLRISSSIPSPEQIKKIYEDEKVLFQENAKCILYGSSDAVTALGYDDDEETLYVGTSSGRSDFRGLRRINNTTTAVTTAISASNGFVAEE